MYKRQVDHDEEAESAPAAPAPVIRRRQRVNPDGSVSELELPGSEPAVPPVPKPDTGAAEDPPDTITPPALAKLHKRLGKEVELYKLHVKHYHMSPTQFRKRTTQLALPDSVYEKYDKVCKGCTVCATPRQAPSRSRISGIRANNFGDIIFCLLYTSPSPRD